MRKEESTGLLNVHCRLAGAGNGSQGLGDKENKPFQLSFNGFLKVDFQGSRVTFDGGLLLVRDLEQGEESQTDVALKTCMGAHGSATLSVPGPSKRKSVILL